MLVKRIGKFASISSKISLTVFIIFIIFTGCAADKNVSQPVESSLDRPAEAIVITGAEISSLAGNNPQKIIAFRWVGKWEQVPVQIDERKTADFYDIYNQTRVSPGVTEIFYADEKTLTDADDDPLFDADDELVFMARNAGAGAPTSTSRPPGVDSDAIEVKISDPLDQKAEGYIYLFVSGEQAGAEASPIYGQYQFNLIGGDYPGDYNFGEGFNPEQSCYTSDFYQRCFSDRWVSDWLKLGGRDDDPVSLIEFYGVQFHPLLCTRTVEIFSRGPGAFIANRSGPVRSIRSYMGANSGPLTERDHLFYDRSEEIITYLRVHKIPSIMVLNDYNSELDGLIYYNSNNREGVAIDGAPDWVEPGFPEWELISGPTGSVVSVNIIDTNISDLEATNYYYDESPTEKTMCLGDDTAWGHSGVYITSEIPDTDSRHSDATAYLISKTINYYEKPFLSPKQAEIYNSQARNRLTYLINDQTDN